MSLIFMADKTNTQPEYVPGPWYVDNTCVPCNSCMDEAGTLLKYCEDQSYVYFAKQPATPEEEAAAQRAADICPTGSIGNDGV
jgi:ferredoxin